MLKPLAAAGRSLVLAVAAGVALVVLASGPMAHDSFQFTSGYTIVAICAGIIINHAVTSERSLVTRTLALSPFVWIGARSYGI
jgi:peptidoglycan/LPS O-acetylase OafA/YrhL